MPTNSDELIRIWRQLMDLPMHVMNLEQEAGRRTSTTKHIKQMCGL